MEIEELKKKLEEEEEKIKELEKKKEEEEVGWGSEDEDDGAGEAENGEEEGGNDEGEEADSEDVPEDVQERFTFFQTRARSKVVSMEKRRIALKEMNFLRELIQMEAEAQLFSVQDEDQLSERRSVDDESRGNGSEASKSAQRQTVPKEIPEMSVDPSKVRQRTCYGRTKFIVC